MMNKLTTSESEFIISRVLDNAKDSALIKDNSEFAHGKRLAYYEILDTIKNELEVRDIDIKGFGLDISLENLL